ncbi:MAG: sodium:solute symporter [bacterium]
MNWLDWTVVGVYMAFLIGLGLFLSLRQKDIEDYYLASGKMNWLFAGVSIMATQLGAISLISAPAFVAIKEGGGLKWLCYELGVPPAMLFTMIFLAPVYYNSKAITIYELLEGRFDAPTRLVVSLLFQISRGLATSVSVLAIGIVISTALGLPLWLAIVGMGTVTLIYDALGGIRVVIISDVVQMGIIFLGIFICGAFAYHFAGGWGEVNAYFDKERFLILDFSGLGWGKEEEYSFWPMTFGGFFLYIAYYGCDQSQVQRQLTVGSLEEMKKSLLFNAFGRFPVVVLYCFLGVFVGTLAMKSPEFMASISADYSDRMIPTFILNYLPHGLIGLIFTALFAASMSTLDSAINSMSAATMRDLYQRYLKKDETDRHALIVSKLFTVFWGGFCIVFALIFAGTARTTIELINLVSSIFYGPIFAVFFLGLLTRWAVPLGVKVGLPLGVVLNICLWWFTPLSWLWWNITGFAATFLTAYAISSFFPRKDTQPPPITRGTIISSHQRWLFWYISVVAYFLAIIGLCFVIQLLCT